MERKLPHHNDSLRLALYCNSHYISAVAKPEQVSHMSALSIRKETPVSMRFRDDDLAIIDRGAALTGLSRTEFMRRAAVQEAQSAILNESVIRLSPDAFEAFVSAIEAEPVSPSMKVIERLQRKSPWDN
ncbi:MAG: DUF1778 domain-containing protein [Pantoea sp.]|uniref:type II toxin-antitoxin system TacA family antitoxin n=1 Tax=Pantoea sp. TaxID=69393 RepID=UPI00239F640A|nr:DUF1778 domain-containing protein [Pantoea sp.]MDE1187867.1 DUF1778 domain-containing protein [Pantoea sp.]